MARYRIVQRPCYLEPGKAEYEVQQHVWLWWWDHQGTCQTLHDAEQRVCQLQTAEKAPIKSKVIKTYD